jgi:hypothetical protein
MKAPSTQRLQPRADCRTISSVKMTMTLPIKSDSVLAPEISGGGPAVQTLQLDQVNALRVQSKAEDR